MTKKQITEVRPEVTEAVYTLARADADQELTAMKEREGMIAQAHEMAGRIQAFTFTEKVVTVAKIVQLKQIKESKIYRGLPNIGTWETYCNYLGLDRHTVDQDILSLNTFGESFLGMCHQFSVGYRDLRKLRQLTHDGSITIDAEAVVIGGERIPLDADHKEDLQSAIETIIEEQAAIKEELEAQKRAFGRVQDDTRKTVTKLERELSKFEKQAAAKGLTPDEDAFLQLMSNKKTSFDGYMLSTDPDFVMERAGEITPRMRSALISTLHYMKMQVLSAYDTAVMNYGSPGLNPEVMEEFEAWEKEQQQV